MKFFIYIITILITIVAASDVLELNPKSLEEFIINNDLALIKFYTPWCGQCKNLEPEYEKAATILKAKNLPIARIDCAKYDELCTEFQIQGYPTLKLFRGSVSEFSEYQGARTSHSISQYVFKYSLPIVSSFDDHESLDLFIKQHPIVVVGFFDPNDEESSNKFSRVAVTFRERFIFAESKNLEIMKNYGIKSLPAAMVFSDFENNPAIFDSSIAQDDFKFDIDTLVEFIKTEAVPLIGEIGPVTFQDYATSGKPLVYIFSDNEKDTTMISEWVKPWALKLKGKLYFGIINATLYGSHALNVNIKENFPALVIENFETRKKWAHSQDKTITKDTLDLFFETYIDGTLEPIIKSEEVPESQNGPVHIVVGKTYDDIVLDKEKDVLIEFYAPWCGHCKSIAPIYDKLGDLFFSHPEFSKKVIVAKIDATSNEFPDSDIRGFPTIKLYPANKKDTPIIYHGARTLENLSEFIKEHGTHKVDGLVNFKDDKESKSDDDIIHDEL